MWCMHVRMCACVHVGQRPDNTFLTSLTAQPPPPPPGGVMGLMSAMRQGVAAAAEKRRQEELLLGIAADKVGGWRVGGKGRWRWDGTVGG